MITPPTMTKDRLELWSNTMDKIPTGSFFVSVLLVPEPMISQVYVLAVVETLMKRTYGGVAEESNVHDGGDCGRSSCVRKFAKGRRVCGKTHIYI